MSAALDALWALQEHDIAIDQLKRRLSSLPERAALHALNERRHAAEAKIAEVARQMDELSAKEEGVETELNTVETRVKQLDDALRSPGSATRDAQAIIHEIDQLKERAGGLEEQGLELLEQRDALQAERDQAQADLDRVADEVPAALAAAQAAEGEAGQELAKLEAERAEILPLVDEATLASYDRKRPKMGGVAVARVVSGACSGCHLSLSAADLDQMAKLPDGQLASCEQCDRILIPA